VTVATLPDVEEIRERIAQRDAAEAKASAAQLKQLVPQIRPLSDVADNYVEYIQNPSNRIMLGIHEIDVMMRGTGKGDLCFIFGQVQQGKTWVMLQSVVHNRDKHILYLTPDEVAEDVLVKLLCIKHGIRRTEFEDRIKAKDNEAVKLLRKAATKEFPHLSIIDTALSLKTLAEIRHKLEDVRQREIDIVMIDYLGSIPGFTDEAAAAKGLKAFGKIERLPIMCIQQSAKSQEFRGRLRGIHGMLYGGQNEATFMVEVVQRYDNESLPQRAREEYKNTITLSLCKNKRGETTTVDLFFDGATGRIRPKRADDLRKAS